MSGLVNLVRVNSATTGTGTLTLGSTITGFINMSDAGAIDGATYSYCIEGSYIAAGDEFVASAREVGRGVYTASGATLTRSVLRSSNSNALLNLTGDQQVLIAILAEDVREILGANRTYYVRTDGNNANNGRTDSSGGAFKDWTYAYNYVATKLDFNGYTVTLQQGTQTFPVTYNGAPSAIAGACLEMAGSWVGGGVLRIIGDRTTPSNVVLNSLTTDAIHSYLSWAVSGTLFIAGFKLLGVETAIYWSACGTLNVGPIEYGTVTDIAHVWCDDPTSEVAFYDVDGPAASFNFTISGSAPYHLLADNGGAITLGDSHGTCSGSPAFSGAFAKAAQRSIISNQFGPASYSGTATGQRYIVDGQSLIDTLGGGASFFPGSTAGTESNGGIYLGITEFREVLTANRTYYVRTDGNDSNTGLANTSGGAFLTPQHAYDVIAAGLDVNSKTVTIQLGTGTFSGLIISTPWLGGGRITLAGNGSANTTIDVAFHVQTNTLGYLRVQAATLTDSGGYGWCIGGSATCLIDTGSDIIFSTAIGAAHITMNAPGAVFDNTNFGGSGYTISTAALLYHFQCSQLGKIRSFGNTTTLSGGALAWNTFVICSENGVVKVTGAYPANAYTGTRYAITTGGVIQTNGGGANYFPGNAAGSGGTTTGGGWYA